LQLEINVGVTFIGKLEDAFTTSSQTMMSGRISMLAVDQKYIFRSSTTNVFDFED